MRYWIKERQNPQLRVHFYAMGMLEHSDAMKHENTLYGVNIMHHYRTKKAYLDQCRKLGITAPATRPETKGE